MKRIGILLSLLAMIFAGCEKIENQYDFVQSNIKSNVTKLLDTKSDSEESDSEESDSKQLEEVQDTNSIDIYKYPILNTPRSSSLPNLLYNPLRLDTTQELGLFNYQNHNYKYLKPQWSMDSLNISFKK